MALQTKPRLGGAKAGSWLDMLLFSLYRYTAFFKSVV